MAVGKYSVECDNHDVCVDMIEYDIGIEAARFLSSVLSANSTLLYLDISGRRSSFLFLILSFVLVLLFVIVVGAFSVTCCDMHDMCG